MKNKNPKWRAYEIEIYNKLKSVFKDCEFERDDWIFGQYSRIDRQIDISVRGEIGGNNILGIVDCKYYGKKIDIKIIESFLGMMDDTKANFGLLITNKGYSPAAKRRISVKNIKLDIIEFDNLNKIQLTFDYFVNNRIRSLELSKFEFHKRGIQKTAWFDPSKSNYRKRVAVYREGYVESENYIYKRMVEISAGWFRDFSEIKKITLYIPFPVKNPQTWQVIEKRIYIGTFNREDEESFFGIQFLNLKEDIALWREKLLGNSKFNTASLRTFAEPFIKYKTYKNYEEDV